MQTAVMSCLRIKLLLFLRREKQLPTMKLLLVQLMTARLALLMIARLVQPGALTSTQTSKSPVFQEPLEWKHVNVNWDTCVMTQ